MEDTINILCATDNNYAPYCGIMLTSLFDNNKDCHFVVYIFEDGSVVEENVEKYQRLASKFGNEIVLKTIDENLLKGFPINDNLHITIPTYYRLFAEELLPDDIHKVIYLDCDIIVKGNIKPLWQVDLNDKAVAGVNDCNGGPQCKRLNYDPSFGYFNAGVMVCNLDYWRKNQLMDRFLEYIQNNRNNKTKLYYMDQDVLNVMLRGEIVLLSERFNFQVKLFEMQFWQDYSEEQRDTFIKEGQIVSIIHYSDSKPWNNKKSFGPLFYEWEKIRKKSLWHNSRVRIPLTKEIKYIIKRAFFPCVLREQLQERWFIPEVLGLFSF